MTGKPLLLASVSACLIDGRGYYKYVDMRESSFGHQQLFKIVLKQNRIYMQLYFHKLAATFKMNSSFVLICPRLNTYPLRDITYM